MLGALIIVFREVIEAGLIVGIVLAVTQGVHGSRLVDRRRRRGRRRRRLSGRRLRRRARRGAGRHRPGDFQRLDPDHRGRHAVWHNVWMASHGRELAAEVKQVGDAVRTGKRSIVALGVVCAVAVMREGSEVALFMYGLAASAGSTTADLLIGSAARARRRRRASRAVTYLGLVTIPPRRLFAVTTLLISFLAAGLAAQAVDLPAAGGRRHRARAQPPGTPRRSSPTRASSAASCTPWSAIPTSRRCCRWSSMS